MSQVLGPSWDHYTTPMGRQVPAALFLLLLVFTNLMPMWFLKFIIVFPNTVTIFPQTSQTQNHFWPFYSILRSCLYRASTRLLDWNELPCKLFLILVRNPRPTLRFLWLQHSFSSFYFSIVCLFFFWFFLPIFIVTGKNGRSLGIWIANINLKDVSFITVIIITLYEFLSKFRFFHPKPVL